MPKVYDDWERLVQATLRKQELWELFHDHSRTPSGGSTSSTATPLSPPASASPLHDFHRLAPLNPIAEVMVPTARVSPLTTNSTSRFNSGSAVNEEEDGNNNGFVEEKMKMKIRTSKSRMRLDRWILTRWLSKTFHSNSP